jgi:hypothetical protein
MSKLHNKWLKMNIEQVLIPALQDQGYEWHKQGKSKEVGRETVLGWPFGSMRRRNLDHVDIIEIQLEKYDRSKFRINVGSCPLEGAREYHGGRHVPAEEMFVSYLEKSWEMCSCPMFPSFFGLRFKSLRNITEADYERLVWRVVSYLPEIEEVLATGKLGPHMRHIQMQRAYETEARS